MGHPISDPFFAVSDPSRRHILGLLSQGNLTVNQLSEQFDMSRPAVSRHLKLLHAAGFIAIEDRGRERHCILKQEGFAALQHWIDYFDAFWQSGFKKLEKLMDEQNEHEKDS